MSTATRMLNSYPRILSVDAGVLAPVIDTVNDCTACVHADWGDHNVLELVKYIRPCLDCGDVCAATARVTNRQTEVDCGVIEPMLETRAATCKSCCGECEPHAEIREHCRICAESCRRCEQSCTNHLNAVRSKLAFGCLRLAHIADTAVAHRRQRSPLLTGQSTRGGPSTRTIASYSCSTGASSERSPTISFRRRCADSTGAATGNDIVELTIRGTTRDVLPRRVIRGAVGGVVLDRHENRGTVRRIGFEAAVRTVYTRGG